MKKCIDVYTVDDARREILLAHRPVKKNLVKSPTRPNGGLPGGGEIILAPHRIQLQSSSSSGANFPAQGNLSTQGNFPDQGNGNDLKPILETVLREDDQDIDQQRLTPIPGQSNNNNNNNLSSSEQDDLPPKLPKLTLQQPLHQGEEEESGEYQERDQGEYQERDRGEYQEEDGTDEHDMAMQESGHSLELEEDGNSLDDADELPLDEREMRLDEREDEREMGLDEREMMMESCLDEGSSLLLPSGSGYGEGYITSSPNKMSPLSRAAAIAAVSAAVSAASSARSPPRRKTSGRIKNWCCLKCPNCLADDCGKCINCLDRPKFGGPFIRKQRCLYKKCLMKGTVK